MAWKFNIKVVGEEANVTNRSVIAALRQSITANGNQFKWEKI